MKRETSPRGRPMQGHGPQTSTNQPSKPGFQQDRRNGQGFRGGGPAPRNGGSYPAKRRWPPTPYDPEPKAQPAPLFAPAGLLTWKRPACPCGKPCFCGPSSIIPGSSRTTRNNSLSCRSPHLRFPGYAMASFRCRPLTIHLTARRSAPNRAKRALTGWWTWSSARLRTRATDLRSLTPREPRCKLAGATPSSSIHGRSAFGRRSKRRNVRGMSTAMRKRRRGSMIFSASLL